MPQIFTLVLLYLNTTFILGNLPTCSHIQINPFQNGTPHQWFETPSKNMKTHPVRLSRLTLFLASIHTIIAFKSTSFNLSWCARELVDPAACWAHPKSKDSTSLSPAKEPVLNLFCTQRTAVCITNITTVSIIYLVLFDDVNYEVYAPICIRSFCEKIFNRC